MSARPIDLFADVLRVAPSAFLRDHWCATPLAASLSNAIADRLHDAFCEGDIPTILTECRKPDNSEYTAEEREEMERDLEAHARTLNLPYCFCRGARHLYAAVVDALGEMVNDVEVGVYISRVGGDVAEWHCDSNHNITIQLAGCKDWHVLPGGTTRADGSRGMFDPPRSRAEQLQAVPATTSAQCFALAPGSVLYLPPGEWHRVVPSSGLSFSVDIRIGHLTAAKWMSEALYASTMHVAMQPPRQPPDAAAAAALLPVGPMHNIISKHDAVPRTLDGCDWLLRCRVPRAFPCESALSDGLHRSASLTFLEARDFLAPKPLLAVKDAAVGISSIVAVTLKRRDASDMLVHLLACSPLTSYEYCRFSILCETELQPPLTKLIGAHGSVGVAELLACCKKPARLMALLRCLVHANVLYLMFDADEDDDPPTTSTAGAVVEPAQPASQRATSKRRRS